MNNIDLIEVLSHQQLQDVCQKANLPTSGTPEALRRCLRASRRRGNAAAAPPPKRQKVATEAVPTVVTKAVPTEDLICPITHELPFDPVTARDGRIYERSAIEKHIQSCTRVGRQLKSPVTNEPMEGPDLLPSFQTKSNIQALIDSGLITGDLLDAWKKKELEKKQMEELLQKAQDGDAKSMYGCYINYRDGKEGFKLDGELAYHWLKKAHASGSIQATASLGKVFIHGTVGNKKIQKNKVHGMVLVTVAAERGSDFAAYKLGKGYAKGWYGLPVDSIQAVSWLQKCVSGDCPYKHVTRGAEKEAREMLEEIRGRNRGDELSSEQPSSGI